MKTFTYERPIDVASAIEALAAPGATALGGGTNLVDLMKIGVEFPRALIDVSHLPLTEVDVDASGTLSVGAAVRNSVLAADPQVRRLFPVLSQAVLAGASGQLRNMATTAGNLMQRTRCSYFMDVTKPCNKREPGTGCPAREGYHRNLAVLGGSLGCIATNPSDLAVALAALDATVRITASGGSRAMNLDDFFRLPGDTPEVETALADGEIITGVTVPGLAAGARSGYRKVRDRASYAFAVVSVAAALTTADDGTVTDVRIALGGVAPRPWRARAAEARLVGDRLTREMAETAIDEELSVAQPLPQNAFKLPLLHRLVPSILLALSEGRDPR
jgi:xanthine dehydrogenase YagS FAD-binding subunit